MPANPGSVAERLASAHPTLNVIERMVYVALSDGPRNTRDLAQIVGISRAALFRAARTLEERGLLARSREIPGAINHYEALPLA